MISLAYILDRLDVTPAPEPTQVTVYSNTDISRARNILDRLLSGTIRHEVNSIQLETKSIEEI